MNAISEADRLAATRADEARRVLDNAAFRDAMAAMKAEIVLAWKDASVRDKEGQQLLLQMAKVADKFEAILIGMIEAGKLARHRIDIDDERAESPARRLMRKVL